MILPGDDPDYFCADCLKRLTLTGCGDPGEMECTRCGKLIQRHADFVDRTERARRMSEVAREFAEWCELNGGAAP